MSHIAARKTILLALPSGTPKHLHIFLTDPIGENPARVLVVNVTTYKHDKQDRTVVLNVGDHPFIQHESIIYFYNARIILADYAQQEIDRNGFQYKEDVSDELYRRIINGLLTSRETPTDIKNFCRQHVILDD